MGPLKLTDLIGQDVNFAVTSLVLTPWRSVVSCLRWYNRSWCWRKTG
jgi:3-hydroxyacyl-CoA dehydrogenase